MKREKRNFFCAVLLPVFLLLALAASPTLSEAASKDAAQASARVMDEAGLLSDADRTSLEKALADVEAAHKVKIAACTVKDLKGEKAGSAANKIVDKLAGSAENGAMVLLVAPKDRDWYLATDKKMKGRITDGVGTDYLSGKFLPAFSKDDYASGFKAYAATADEMLAYYEKEGEPFDPKAGFSLLALAAAVVLAGGVFYLVRSSLIASMSNVMAATEADAYLSHEGLHLTENRDTFLYMNVTRKEKPKKQNTSSSRDENHGGGGGKY